MPCAKKRTHEQAIDDSTTPQIPILWNPSKIKEHTQLYCPVDHQLDKIAEIEKKTKRSESYSCGID